MKVKDFVERYAVDRHNTDCFKWDGLQNEFGSTDLLPLWVADTEFKVPEAVTQALQARIAHGVYGYSQVVSGYQQAYINWQQQRYQTEIHPEWMRFGTGVVQSLSTLINVLTEPQEAVMVLQPVYYPFMQVIENNQRKLVVSQLKRADHHYEMDFTDIEQKIKQQHVKLLINCSPHNPVGRVWSEAELTKLLKICRENKVLFISDEIHHDLIVGQRPFVSALSIDNGLYRDNMVMVDSASKTFNLAALQNNHLIIPNPQIRTRYDNYIQRLKSPAGSLMGQVAAKAAYENGAEWLSGMLALIKQNFTYLKTHLAAENPAIEIFELEGTYLAWIDLSQVIPPTDLERVMKNDAKLAVDFGKWFGQGGDGFVRINLATTPANIELAVKRLKSVIKK
ncbi:aminotransferase [Liquorilactobacillus ghanensis DSM 18630]|uniref:cysteine-S-conjugate beta-lyase n=1 Tax=Liquorilactobacillus ghanensis DSM 18630 TaxID=1423750 RepID=A0A0R1VVX7_9LACO|nr:MalY/PatB family protein [Liquorilactobacillus ghanensis]KRM07145.1 aminotransferase [Liquorilactobacillus ghanensis DSM 18630]